MGCFIFFKENGHRVISPDGLADIKKSESVLLKCGNHFVDLIKELGDGVIEVVFIHLFPQVLQSIYQDELPKLLQKRVDFNHLNVISKETVLEKYVESLDFYFATPELVNEEILNAKMKELIQLLIVTNNVGSIYELVADLSSGSHAQVKEVVRQHLYSNRSIEELAIMCNMSLSTFNRAFKKEFSASPVKYINQQRVNKAKDLLHDLTLSMADIAYEIGFNDPLYFSRIFKRLTGRSPSQFRKEI